MRCSDVLSLLKAYDCGKLPLLLELEVDEHLHFCSQCSLAYLLLKKNRIKIIREQFIQIISVRVEDEV